MKRPFCDMGDTKIRKEIVVSTKSIKCITFAQ